MSTNAGEKDVDYEAHIEITEKPMLNYQSEKVSKLIDFQEHSSGLMIFNFDLPHLTDKLYLMGKCYR